MKLKGTKDLLLFTRDYFVTAKKVRYFCPSPSTPRFVHGGTQRNTRQKTKDFLAVATTENFPGICDLCILIFLCPVKNFEWSLASFRVLGWAFYLGQQHYFFCREIISSQTENDKSQDTQENPCATEQIFLFGRQCPEWTGALERKPLALGKHATPLLSPFPNEAT